MAFLFLFSLLSLIPNEARKIDVSRTNPRCDLFLCFSLFLAFQSKQQFLAHTVEAVF